MSYTNRQQPFDPVTVPLEASNLIEASAGTGKTYSIAILTLRLVLEKKIPVQQILMVTFTRAAVAELETRIRLFMRNALKVSQGATIKDEAITRIVALSMKETANGPAITESLLKEAVLFLDETAILTIHSFCQRVLTEFAFETGQVFGSAILTDLNALLTDRVNAFWRKYITTVHTPVLKELINAGLNRASLLTVIGNSISGKEMIVAAPLPEGFLSAGHQLLLEVQFHAMNVAETEMHNSIIQYLISNSAAIRSATANNPYAKKNMLECLDDPELLLQSIKLNSDKAYVKKVYQEILAEIGKLDAITAAKEREAKTVINQVYQLAIQITRAEVNRYKQQNNQLGFDDMITKLHEAVVVNNNEFLNSSLRAKYKAAFIDEFQDTDKMQYEIFNRLFAKESVLFYIGDPKQSIYAWRKADIFTYFKAKEEVANQFGMNVNYRSSNRMIESMNAFFLPAAGFDTFYFNGEAGEILYTNVSAPGTTTRGELNYNNQVEVPLTIFENSNNESISQAVAAQIIQLLSDPQYTITEKEIPRKLRPSDIGILVRKNSQAAQVKQLLSTYGIPAVTIDDTKLFQSAGARELLYLLEAVIDINASAINKALLSPLTGFAAADILAMDDEQALNRFKEYQHLWEQEGVYVMLTSFIRDYKVKQVLLNDTTGNGERLLTNVLQLMELLHKVQTQQQYASLELAHWLKKGIEGMAVEGDEFEQRVESDEEAVKIVTIHKSKGLEYNIVFAPFLDLLAGSSFEFVTFRDEDSGNYLFGAHDLLELQQLQLTHKQLEQENRRLVYVAVTRAVYKCYINRNTYGKFNESALAPFITAIKANPSPLVAFEASPPLPEKFRYSNAGQQFAPAYLQATDFHLEEVNWRKLSYTYLDAGHAPFVKSSSAKVLTGYDEFIFKQLKRGANTGNLLHYIFERIDFTNSTHWEKVVGDGLKRWMPAFLGDDAIGLLELLQQVTATRIKSTNSSFALQEVPMNKRLNELEFNFNVALFSPADINRLSTAEVPFQIRYARELEGIMNGKIDLFFEHGGKYYILDWKSNFLGDHPSAYSGENIAQAMEASNYHLQYLVYTLAVKKYLQLRLPGFNYTHHFGGVIYLFVRGIRKDGNNGIFTYRPGEQLINNLERLLVKG